MLKIISAYKYIQDPINLVENFDTKKEFEDWLSLGTKEDLKHTLKAFEQSELYEYCVIIRDKIKEM